MRRISILLALALVVALTVPAVAEVEEVTVGGAIQIRAQVLTPGVVGNVSGFDEDNSSYDWATARASINVDAKLSGGVRGFVELHSFDVWGSNFDTGIPGAPELDPAGDTDSPELFAGGDYGLFAGQGDDTIQLYQAYIEMNDLGDYPLQVRIGRQELVYGREWLLGNNNAGRNFSGLAFDAIKASYDTDLYRVDAWFSKLVDFSSPLVASIPAALAAGFPENDADIDFYGVYGTYKGIENLTIDGYWMFVRNAAGKLADLSVGGDVNWVNTDKVNTLHTIGGRVAGGWEVGDGMLDASGELAFQFGDTGMTDGITNDAGDYEGWAANIMGGYTFTNVEWTPRIEAEYAYFSGDDELDEDMGSFVRLFSDVHYGELNIGGNLDAGTSNMHIIRVGASAVPVEKLTVRGDFYYFMLAEDDVAGGATTFGVNQVTGFDDDVGYELDLIADYQYTEDLNLRVGWAHFFADDAVENSWGGGVDDDDMDYVYAQATLVF
jgi:hypothetical protein